MFVLVASLLWVRTNTHVFLLDNGMYAIRYNKLIACATFSIIRHNVFKRSFADLFPSKYALLNFGDPRYFLGNFFV